MQYGTCTSPLNISPSNRYQHSEHRLTQHHGMLTGPTSCFSTTRLTQAQ